MAIITTDTTMTSDLEPSAVLTKQCDGLWKITSYPIDARFLGAAFSQDQAITALHLAEHLAIWDPGYEPGISKHYCDKIRTWDEALTAAAQPARTVTGTPTHALCCLYCGSSEDIYEVLVTIDERTSEYASECGLCHGVWAP